MKSILLRAVVSVGLCTSLVSGSAPVTQFVSDLAVPFFGTWYETSPRVWRKNLLSAVGRTIVLQEDRTQLEVRQTALLPCAESLHFEQWEWTAGDEYATVKLCDGKPAQYLLGAVWYDWFDYPEMEILPISTHRSQVRRLRDFV